MRLLIIAFLAVAASQLVPRPAQAEVWYPWCAYLDAWASSCGYRTYEQCRAAVSGDSGYCRPNPYPAPMADTRGRRR